MQPKLVEPNAADLHLVLEHRDRIGAVVPQVSQRIGRSGRPCVVVGKKEHSACDSLVDDLFEFGVFVGTGGKLRVRISNRELIERTDSDGVGIRKIEFAVPYFDERRGIVHHRAASVRAGGKIVCKAQRMPHLVRRELANAGIGHCGDLVRRVRRQIINVRHEAKLTRIIRRSVLRRHPGTEQKILPGTLRVERYIALKDLAGSRIDNAVADRPAACRAVHPIDDVVAHIHRVGVRRQHLDLKSVSKTRGLVGLIPPSGTLDQCVLYLFRRTVINVINYRLNGLADGRRRVFFLEPVALYPTLFEILVDVGAVIVKADRDRSCSRVKTAWAIFVVRQLDKRMAFADRDMASGGRDLIDEIVGLAGCRKRDGRLDLGVFRKALGVRQVECAAAFVKTVRALPHLIDAVADTVRVADQKVGRVN